MADEQSGDYKRAINQAIQRKARIRELESQLAERDKQIGALATERDGLSTQVGDLTTRIKGFEAAPSELQKEVDRLNGQVKQRDHRTAYEKAVAKFQGEKGERIRSDALDDLYGFLGGAPEGDLPDEAGFSEAIKSAVSTRSYLLQGPEPGQGGNPNGGAAAKPPGPGASRGGAQQQTTTPNATEAARAASEATGRTNAWRIA